MSLINESSIKQHDHTQQKLAALLTDCIDECQCMTCCTLERERITKFVYLTCTERINSKKYKSQLQLK